MDKKKNLSCNIHMVSFLKNKARSSKYTTFPVPGPLGLPEGEYTFEYDYPLSKVASFKRRLNGRHSARNILRFAARDYERIYKSEDNPGYIPGMLNRAQSDGPYGIWGHYMGDLYFESIHIDEKRRRITFGIGS